MYLAVLKALSRPAKTGYSSNTLKISNQYQAPRSTTKPLTYVKGIDTAGASSWPLTKMLNPRERNLPRARMRNQSCGKRCAYRSSWTSRKIFSSPAIIVRHWHWIVQYAVSQSDMSVSVLISCYRRSPKPPIEWMHHQSTTRRQNHGFISQKVVRISTWRTGALDFTLYQKVPELHHQ